MTTLFELNFFVLIAETGSLSAAARVAGITPAAASLALKRMENRLSTRLFARSTRNQRLTNEGKLYLQCVRQALMILETGEREISDLSNNSIQTLQIAAPTDFGKNLLLELLDDFKKQNPNINFHLTLGDQTRDQYRENIDFNLRYGAPSDSEIVALPIFKDHFRVACASYSYLKLHGEPLTPEDLENHSCILHRINGVTNNSWFFSKGDEIKNINVRGDFIFDDAEAARRWAISGHGVILSTWLDVALDVKEGRLRPLLCDWRGEHIPFFLTCPHRTQITDLVRSLHKLIIARCSTLAIETFLKLDYENRNHTIKQKN